MTYEREDYMRRQEMDHDMIRMRQGRPENRFYKHPDALTDLLTATQLERETLRAALQKIADYEFGEQPWYEAAANQAVIAKQALKDVGQWKG